MSDNRDWQADKINNLLKRCEIAKSYGETIAVSPDAIIELSNQAAEEKSQADYWREATRQGNIELEAAEAREQKLVQHLRSYMPHMWPAMAAHFEVLLDAMYPKEATNE